MSMVRQNGASIRLPLERNRSGFLRESVEVHRAVSFRKTVCDNQRNIHLQVRDVCSHVYDLERWRPISLLR